MAIPAFDPLSLGETAAGHPLLQHLWRKIKDNFESHNGRIAGAEGITATYIADHFTGELDAAKWIAYSNGLDTSQIAAANHYFRMADAAGANGALRSRLYSRPPQLPFIRARARAQVWANTENAQVGLLGDIVSGFSIPVVGVCLHKRRDKSLVFACAKSASTGSFWYDQAATLVTKSDEFSQPPDNNWFEVEIEYTSAKVCECRFNGTLVITFNSDLGDLLPDSNSFLLYANAVWQRYVSAGGSDGFDVDRIEYGSISEGDLP